MAFREVTMIEIKEVLRRWLSGEKKKKIAINVGLDPKTVRRILAAASQCELSPCHGSAALTEERLCAVMTLLKIPAPREASDSRKVCESHSERIAGYLKQGVRLTKVHRLLKRDGIQVPYSALYRYARQELEFGRKAPTVRLAEGNPGEEIQVDTGWMTALEPDENGRRKRFRAFIFTPRVSRYRFVFPCLRETTEDAIVAFEAAWEFYGGVFSVVVIDNMKAVVNKADPLEPKLIDDFLEYAQARGFTVDTTRVRKPKDKAVVERAVQDVRNDCFGGERIQSIEQARERAKFWCMHEYGVRRHTTTQRLPREHFFSDEKPVLKPFSGERYDIPVWSDPKVARDHYAQVERALYSLPTKYIGKKLRARADSKLVRFYLRGVLIKIHPKQKAGGKSTDSTDFPPEKTAYALRDIEWLRGRAEEQGPFVGAFAGKLLSGNLPWTRMRQVYALLGLAKRYGQKRVDDVCALALSADMLSIKRLSRMLETAAAPDLAEQRTLPTARFLRPTRVFSFKPQRGSA